MKLYIIIASVFTVALAQQRYSDNHNYEPPVAILKQIDKHNEDGSYSYGYEAADGSFKIETKYPDGEVYGKYGYIDDNGKLREVEYGASRRGFEPVGNDIQVPPPTLKSNPQALARPLAPNEEDDGQYREDPSAYYKNDPNYVPRPQSNYQPRFEQPSYQQPAYQPPFRPQHTPYTPPQPAYRPQPTPYTPQPAYRPQPQYNNYAPAPQPYYNPAPPAYPGYNQFQGHPATNVDIFSGSYSVNYRR